MSDDKLDDKELEVVFYVERYNAQMGESPTDDQIKMRYKDVDQNWLDKFKTNPLVLKSMHVRGLIYPAPQDQFSPEMMHAASAMLDYTDRRSDEKKLRDLGITTRQWSMWIQNANFADYLRQRSELMLSNSMHEAHRGLIKGMKNGNLQNITKYYEITGRHDPNKEAQVNVRQLLHSFIEVIQRYVKDPIILHQIATDMSNLATRESYATSLAANVHGRQALMPSKKDDDEIVDVSTIDLSLD